MARRWLPFLAVAVVAGVVGAGVAIGSVEVNRATATDAFCTSCHSMTVTAEDAHFTQSAHRAGEHGVVATCGDCHIDKSNWFVETYTHATEGARDVFAELTGGPFDPAKWAVRRVELAQVVRDQMRASNSVTCRNCHDAASIQPRTDAGKAAHALMMTGAKTCIDCHFNLVHSPVPPSPEFLRGSWTEAARK